MFSWNVYLKSGYVVKRKPVVKTIKLMIRGGGFEFPFFYFWRITLCYVFPPRHLILHLEVLDLHHLPLFFIAWSMDIGIFCDFSDGGGALSFSCLLRTLTAVLRICLEKFLWERILSGLGLTRKEELYTCFPFSLNSCKSRHSTEVRATVSILNRTFHLL